jgi:hypothetical protein
MFRVRKPRVRIAGVKVILFFALSLITDTKGFQIIF